MIKINILNTRTERIRIHLPLVKLEYLLIKTYDDFSIPLIVLQVYLCTFRFYGSFRYLLFFFFPVGYKRYMSSLPNTDEIN